MTHTAELTGESADIMITILDRKHLKEFSDSYPEVYSTTKDEYEKSRGR